MIPHYAIVTAGAIFRKGKLEHLPPLIYLHLRMWYRAEKLALAKWHGKMILMGALLCVGGTMMVSLLKGRLLHLWPTNLLKSHAQAPVNPGSPHQDMVVGTLWLCGSCLSYAIYFIVQVLAWNLDFPWLTYRTVSVFH
jgi:hypothetical protein